MIDVQTSKASNERSLHESLGISGPSGTGRMFFQGAHIVDWTPIGTKPVLWLRSPDQSAGIEPIRGGIPICLPWFGRRATPRHGIARMLPWQLTKVDQNPEHVTLTFDLHYQPTATSAPAWPHPFSARFQATFSQLLSLTLQVTHLGDRPALYEPALHPYFQVGDVNRVRISGLDGAPFIDHGTSPGTSTEPELAFDGQLIDRVYACSSAITIHDDANGREIILRSPDARSRIIWNPGSEGSNSLPDLADDDWRSFLCVEPGNVHDNAITLDAGQQHSFTSEIQVISAP
jgi:glucose-6-phosphate 1-epimerase